MTTATTLMTTRMTTTTNHPDPLFADGCPVPGAADARLEELYEQHGRTVLGLCRMLLRDPSEAEDAAQQTFLSAYGSLLAGSEPRYPAAWLATIARNECWSRIQQRMRQPLHEPVAEETAATTLGPLEAAIRNADLAALLTAIGELPRQQRDALLLREFSGLSYGELAKALSVSEPAVESLLVRARRELRIRLQPAYAACLAPFLFVRDLFSRLGAGGESTLGAAAKLASLPLAAKLAAGVATIALVGGAVVGADRQLVDAGYAESPQPAANRSSPAVGSGLVDARPGSVPQRQGVAGARRDEKDGQGSSDDGSPSSGGDRSGGGDGPGDDKGKGSRSGDDSGSDFGGSPASAPAVGGHGSKSGDDGPGDDDPAADDDTPSGGSGGGELGDDKGDDGGDGPVDDPAADDDGGGADEPDPGADDPDTGDDDKGPGDDGDKGPGDETPDDS